MMSINNQTKWSLSTGVIYSWLNSYPKEEHSVLISRFSLVKTMNSDKFGPFSKVLPMTLSQNEVMKTML